jgi:hypothetical protein
MAAKIIVVTKIPKASALLAGKINFRPLNTTILSKGGGPIIACKREND